MIAIIHLFIIVTSFYEIVNLCKLKILYHEELLIVCNEKTQQNNPFTKKGPVVSNRTFPKMAKSNSYLTLPLYNTQNTYRCVEQ